MKQKLVVASLLALSATVVSSPADVLFSDNFNTYANGNLVGQGPWLQTSTSATTPVQVTSSAAVLGTSGQDVYAPLSSVYTIPTGSTFDIGLDLTVSSAQTTGDYFLHTTPTAGNSSIFPDRVFVKSSGSGYVLGYESTSGGTVTPTYGTMVLSFNTDYRVVLVYNNVSGALNDTASLYVDPTDLSVEANNTAYVSDVPWGSTSAESDVVAAVNFRQGSATAAPAETVDNLIAGTSFGDVAPAPEPSTLALFGMGGAAAGLFAIRRRKA